MFSILEMGGSAQTTDLMPSLVLLGCFCARHAGSVGLFAWPTLLVVHQTYLLSTEGRVGSNSLRQNLTCRRFLTKDCWALALGLLRMPTHHHPRI